MESEHTDNAADDAFPYDMQTFREWVKSVRQQFDQMKEQISKLEHERESTTPSTQASHQLPDSNGFWRDVDGDIWEYDGNPDHPPRFIFSTTLQEVCETPMDITATWATLEDYAPFTKIDNPFIEREDHAD